MNKGVNLSYKSVTTNFFTGVGHVVGIIAATEKPKHSTDAYPSISKYYTTATSNLPFIYLMIII